MSTSSVFNLTRFTALASGDVIPAVDISDVTQSAHGSLNAMTVTNFFASIPVPVVVTAGTVTVSTPVFDATETWNAGGVTFTGIRLNVTSTASAAASLLADLQLAGATKFNVRKDGLVTAVGGLAVTAGGVTVSAGGGNVRGTAGTTPIFQVTNGTDMPTAVTSGGVNFAFVGNNASTGPRMIGVGDAGGSGVRFVGAYCGSTVAAPAATPSGSTMVIFGARGYGTAWVSVTDAAYIAMSAVNTWSGTDNSTQITIATTPTGSTTPTVALTITAAQAVVPAALLDISGASAGQIKFPATQNASADVNTLDDYEEGTWTPADGSGAALTFTATGGTYEKIGRLVIARCTLTYPATGDGSNAVVSGLPFTTANAEEIRQGFVAYTTETTLARAFPAKNGTTVGLQNSAGAAVTNATMSLDQLYFTAMYHI